jgi:hypothetical protein
MDSERTLGARTESGRGFVNVFAANAFAAAAFATESFASESFTATTRAVESLAIESLTAATRAVESLEALAAESLATESRAESDAAAGVTDEPGAAAELPHRTTNAATRTMNTTAAPAITHRPRAGD